MMRQRGGELRIGARMTRVGGGVIEGRRELPLSFDCLCVRRRASLASEGGGAVVDTVVTVWWLGAAAVTCDMSLDV